MVEYVKNLQFTPYALEKANRNLAGEREVYNFSKALISNPEYILDDDTEPIAGSIYKLDIESTEQDKNTFYIKTLVGAEIKGIVIIHLGLYINDNGKEKLFAVGTLYLDKPEDIVYALSLDFNILLTTVNLTVSQLPLITVEDYEYTSITDTNDLRNVIVYSETNLERVIYKNTQSLGYNRPQVFFSKLYDVENLMGNVNSTFIYNRLLHHLDYQSFTDAFFLLKAPFLVYKINNLVHSDSYIQIENNLWESKDDNLNFYNQPNGFTLCFRARLNSSLNGTVLAKVGLNSNQHFYSFSVVGSRLKFSLSSTNSSYNIYYNLDTLNVRSFTDMFNTYFITFKIEGGTPYIDLYLNGKLLTTEKDPIPLQELLDSTNIPLRNFTEYQVINPSTYPEVSNILGFNKVLSEQEMNLTTLLLNS